jgi:hypothetical protein
MAFFAVTRFWSYGGSLDREDDKLASWEETGASGNRLGEALRYFRKIGTGNRQVHAQPAGQENPAEEISVLNNRGAAMKMGAYPLPRSGCCVRHGLVLGSPVI